MKDEKKSEMNGDTLLFAVFCIEGIAESLKIDGAEVYKLLTGEGKILDTYILEYYDALHTQSKEYIVDELVELMKKESFTAGATDISRRNCSRK
ncbi:MAG: DUF3791 domain-containing protein [Gracilibacteraceae bacterium]|jgi:hypothetical protein|nr:DUF3791 domain-containing protein [Gracilibacteraceae bacterium]